MSETHAVLNVPSISCNHCKMAIEGAVGALAGVRSVAVDVGAKSVTVDFESGDVTLVGKLTPKSERAIQDQAIIRNTNRSGAGLAGQNPGCYRSTGISAFPPGQ